MMDLNHKKIVDICKNNKNYSGFSYQYVQTIDQKWLAVCKINCSDNELCSMGLSVNDTFSKAHGVASEMAIRQSYSISSKKNNKRYKKKNEKNHIHEKRKNERIDRFGLDQTIYNKYIPSLDNPLPPRKQPTKKDSKYYERVKVLDEELDNYIKKS